MTNYQGNTTFNSTIMKKILVKICLTLDVEFGDIMELVAKTERIGIIRHWCYKKLDQYTARKYGLFLTSGSLNDTLPARWVF